MTSYISRLLTIVPPVDIVFLHQVCEWIYKDLILPSYNCEICDNKYQFNQLSLCKDFLICERCIEDKNLDKIRLPITYVEK